MPGGSGSLALGLGSSSSSNSVYQDSRGTPLAASSGGLSCYPTRARRRDGEHGRAHARDADLPAAPSRRTDPDHRLVEVRRNEALRLPARTHVARGARGRDGVGRAPVLLAAIDRSPTRALARRALVESPAELRLHARRLSVRWTPPWGR